jgi:hypothetical protein
MPWDGNGTFDRVHNFSADASAGIQAQAARFDAEFDGFKTGLENCVTVDGQTTVTGDADMGGFKHTGVAAATSTDNYLRADQNANQVGIFVRDVNTGVTGRISASAAVFPTAFTDGQRVTVKVSADGSTSATRTIAINGLSANILDNEGSAVPASKMLQNGIFDLVYDADASAFRTVTPRNDLVYDEDSGNLSAVWVGFASANWHRSGKTVHLRVSTMSSANSDSSAMRLTNLPASLTPTVAQVYPVTGLVDNGSATFGSVLISGTSATFGFGAGNPLGGGFTTSGVKGFQTASISFSWSLF